MSIRLLNTLELLFAVCFLFSALHRHIHGLTSPLEYLTAVLFWGSGLGVLIISLLFADGGKKERKHASIAWLLLFIVFAAAHFTYYN